MPPSLYRLSLLRLAVLVDRQGLAREHLGPRNNGPLNDLAGAVLEDLLMALFALDGGAVWRDRWLACLTPRLQCSPAAWDPGLLRLMAARCPSLRRLWILGCDHFKPEVLPSLPPCVLTVDFDGQLYFRARPGPALRSLAQPEQQLLQPPQRQPWLVQAEAQLRALSAEHQKVPDIKLQPGLKQLQLVELHLGEAQASAEHIKDILRQLPQLRLLRHYLLVTALYQLHAAAWRQGDQLPTYKLRNLDMDFSHVVRCRMSPEPVLAGDALQLAVLLCPSCTQVRARFDPQTPHDALAAAGSLARLHLLSAVCVSSGQRAHLDFSDVAVLLERHGDHLRTLELKVLEEVDVHQIVALCPRLEELVLSGCGNVVPACCSSWGCGSTRTSRPATLGPLRRLRLLFFADGDDFSWDHDVPQCFWRWTLLPVSGRSSHLEGIFLESPRFDSDTRKMITTYASTHKGPMYPDLEVLSVCRAPEFTVDLVAAMSGLSGSELAALGATSRASRAAPAAPAAPAAGRALRLVQLNQCDQLGPAAARTLEDALQCAARVVVD